MTRKHTTPSHANAPTSRQSVARTERQAQAVRLRIQGHSTMQIAEQLGVSRISAWRYLRDAMEQRRGEIAEDAETLRAIEVERIEANLRSLQPGLEAGEPAAHRAALGWHQHLAKLQGLQLQADAAQGPQVVVVDARMPWERGDVIDGEVAHELPEGGDE